MQRQLRSNPKFSTLKYYEHWRIIMSDLKGPWSGENRRVEGSNRTIWTSEISKKTCGSRHAGDNCSLKLLNVNYNHCYLSSNLIEMAATMLCSSGFVASITFIVLSSSTTYRILLIPFWTTLLTSRSDFQTELVTLYFSLLNVCSFFFSSSTYVK